MLEDEEFLRPVKPELAREQAAECLGFLRGRLFDLGDGQTWELPNPSFLDDEQQRRYNQHLLDEEQLDRHPDETADDGTLIRRGLPKDPPRIKGKLAEPSDIRLAKALMGEQIHAKFLAAGGRSSQVRIHWWEMNKRVGDRVKNDSKSAERTVAVEPVPD